MERHHRTYVVWLRPSSLPALLRCPGAVHKSSLRIFAETVMFCDQRIEQGVYDPNDRYWK
jgi:hypothetical protein